MAYIVRKPGSNYERFPHDKAGGISTAYVVREPGSTITAEEIMCLVAEQVEKCFPNCLADLQHRTGYP